MRYCTADAGAFEIKTLFVNEEVFNPVLATDINPLVIFGSISDASNLVVTPGQEMFHIACPNKYGVLPLYYGITIYDTGANPYSLVWNQQSTIYQIRDTVGTYLTQSSIQEKIVSGSLSAGAYGFDPLKIGSYVTIGDFYTPRPGDNLSFSPTKGLQYAPSASTLSNPFMITVPFALLPNPGTYIIQKRFTYLQLL